MNTIWPIVPYAAFTLATPTIPKFYWDVYSQEQRWKHICCELGKLVDYADSLGVAINLDHADIEELQRQFAQFQATGFNEYYEAQVESWINANLDYIFNTVLKTVYFGINQEGYFVAYYPESWSDIIFDTGYQYALDTYGRLILRYNVDTSSSVNQMPEIVR